MNELENNYDDDVIVTAVLIPVMSSLVCYCMSCREDAPVVKLKFTVSPSLKKQLKKLAESRDTLSEVKVEEEVAG